MLGNSGWDGELRCELSWFYILYKQTIGETLCKHGTQTNKHTYGVGNILYGVYWVHSFVLPTLMQKPESFLIHLN